MRFIGCAPTCTGEDASSASAAPVDGLLKSPYGVGTCLDGTVLVADTANHRVQLLNIHPGRLDCSAFRFSRQEFCSIGVQA